MSFECEECHKVATGKTHAEAAHFMGSYGRCETCHRTGNCADCHCNGNWAYAYQKSQTQNTDMQVADLKAILDDTT